MNRPVVKENIKILVVDDERGWRDLFAWELASKGYDVTVADGGLDAIEKSKQETFDLVITDLKMCGMDGVETFTSIRKIQPNVKVILMTGYAADDRIQEGLNSKASACIRKPFDLNLMLQTIQQTLFTSPNFNI